jgi:Ca2+-binding RTX toxin-like protein
MIILCHIVLNYKSPALQLGELCALIFLIAGGGVLSLFVPIAWAGDDNGDDNSQWSKNEWDKDSLSKNERDIIYGTGLIFGTNHADFIIADTPAIAGDVIFAKDGDDEIQSGPWGDQVYGEDGEDTIQTGFGVDQLFGGNGNDNLIAGEDDDYLLGGSGDDHLWAWFGDDALRGGNGADFFDCGEGIDEIKDFSVAQGDIRLANCEIVNTED